MSRLSRLTTWFAGWRGGTACPRTLTAVPPALAWVDEFIADIRSYVVVRLEDNLLIRMPNQAHKLNPEGARMLDYLLGGGRVADIVARINAGSGNSSPDNDQQLSPPLRDVALFLDAVRRCLSGELREDTVTCAVDVRPLEVRFSELPVLSEVAVTGRCNLRCVFCYAGCAGTCSRVPENVQGPTMSTAQVKTVLERIRYQARVPSVSFTGGEPTLRADLPELVAFASGNLGMRVNLITNGTLVSRKSAVALVGAGLASAQVSIEGPNAIVHDRVTQVDGSFERSCRAVAYFREAGVTVHCNTTINRRNLDAVTEMPGFARKELGLARLSMNMVIPAGSASRVEDEADSPLIRYTDMASLVLSVQRAAEQAGMEFMWYSPTPLCLFNPITAELGNKGCSACDGLLSVDPRGRILPCSSCDDPMGDLLREDFRTIWNRPSSTAYRDKRFAHPSCRQCDHFAFCHGGCPLYWRHFGFGELETVRGFPAHPPPCIPSSPSSLSLSSTEG
ncbi:radical SAM/SPASM domain-containing protein [Desulfobulbus alkaliphilus]|uniref:radical SAM/SPASM domain-containing protein n=1 Tax=Desulfobulbus alkaliphilus TaxID=869814 RepID=UPI001965F3A5|nr:radical SAM protein [Desulfobulbus alkaliphilus]MBM9536223.1 radical SAM protein [Desulfobulbus alkaliphilus]